MKKSTVRTFGYFWSHAKHWKWLYLTILFFVGVGVLINDILVSYLYKLLVDEIAGFQGVDRSTVVSALVGVLLYIGLAYFVAEVGAWRLGGYLNSIFQTRVIKKITDDCFKAIHAHSLGFFANNFAGSLVSKVKKIYRAFEDVADVITWDFYTTFIRLSASMVVLWVLAPMFTVILLVWSVFFMLAIWFFSMWKMKVDLEESSYESRVTAELADTIGNAANVKIFTNFGHEFGRFKNVTEKKRAIQKKSWGVDELMRMFAGFSMIFVELGMMYYAVTLWTAGSLTIGSLVLIQSILYAILKNLWDFGRVLRIFYRGLADADEMMEILELDREIKNPVMPEKGKISKGEIEFKDVTFRYEGKTLVFKNFNLKIKAGMRVGIVGESGAGKSTITKLIMRFSDVNRGVVLIDGQDVKKLRQEDLREKIAYVPQEPILFHRTLMENIRYGRLKATNKEVFEAAKKAHADDFILGTPKGYNTLVGERGVKLSGGERQRVAIARAMLADSPVLILDEATSSLDSKAEKLIQDALAKLMAGRTTLVIAHRLSTLRQMDEIIVFHKGRVVERGSHKELLKNKGKYAELWAHQAGGFIV